MLLLLLVLMLAIDVATSVYLIKVTRRRVCRPVARRIALGLCVVAIVLMSISLGAPVIFASRLPEWAYYRLMKWLFLSLATGVGVMLFVIIDLLASITLIFKRKRVKALSIAGAALAVVTFGAAIWAMCINRFNYRVNEVEIQIADLPAEFDGYTIAQISDLHVGTFEGDTAYVSRLVDRINSLHPDLVVFTGDIVNRHSSEAEPFMPVLDRLRGRDGQFAILGNHDYADYFYKPADSIAKASDRQHLRDLYASTHLCLLEDSAVTIRRGNDSIVVIGVGNIGTGRFPAYGSVTKAYATPSDSVTKILLSHDPNHWVTAIADNPDYNIALTLSGHTHAMQTMLFGHTPASFTTRTPAGLYHDTQNARHLYVNIGAGTVGMPMRLGANPEITLIRLKP